MAKFIPLSVPNFEGNERKYVDEAIEQGWVSTGGAFINKLEEDLAKFLNVQSVAACQSGTAGIHLALIDAGVSRDDLVLVPTLTFIAAVNPVKYLCADPVFIDCDDSLCMDPVKIEEFCHNECQFSGGKLVHKNTGRVVKAIVVVHVFGNLADMEKIMEIASKYGLKVIEDSTEALGSKFTSGKYDGCMAGTVADYGVYSFNGNKIITTGGGGAVVAKNAESQKHIKYLSTQAKDDDLFYVHNEIGYNYRMTNVQAAIGVAQVEELPEFIVRKKANYDLYCELFAGFDLGKMVGFREGTDSNKWFYSLDIAVELLDCPIRTIIEELQSKGIQTRPIWGLIHNQLPYRDCEKYEIERAEYYEKRILNIPCSTNISKEDILYVAEGIKEVLQRFRRK